jgi:hypothetical protein
MTSSAGNNLPPVFPLFPLACGTGAAALCERIQLTSAAAFVTTTIAFNYTQGVYVQNLVPFDVDFSTTWVDQIRNIKGVTASGQTVNPVAVVGNSLMTVTGSQTTGWTATGNGTVNGGAGGDLSISFDSYRVSRLVGTMDPAPRFSLLRNQR